jgi:hypothetical protein
VLACKKKRINLIHLKSFRCWQRVTHSWIVQSRFSLQTRARWPSISLFFHKINLIPFCTFIPSAFSPSPRRRRCQRQRTAFILRRQIINPGAGPLPSSRTLLSPFELKATSSIYLLSWQKYCKRVPLCHALPNILGNASEIYKCYNLQTKSVLRHFGML